MSINRNHHCPLGTPWVKREELQARNVLAPRWGPNRGLRSTGSFVKQVASLYPGAGVSKDESPEDSFPSGCDAGHSTVGDRRGIPAPPSSGLDVARGCPE